MRRGLLAVVLMAVLVHSPAKGDTASNVGKFLNPIGTAQKDIAQAREMVRGHGNLDMTRFTELLSEAHKLAPALDHQNAAEWRQAAIRILGVFSGENTLGLIDEAVTLNPSLAFEDTISRICGFYSKQPPAVARAFAKRAKDEEKIHGKPGPRPVVVVPYREIPVPEGAIRPYAATTGGNVYGAPPESWPRITHRVEPEDPRGPNAPKVNVVLVAKVGRGRPLQVTGANEHDPVQVAAANAVRQWTFIPFTFLGHEIETLVNIEITLGGTAANHGNAAEPPSSTEKPADAAVNEETSSSTRFGISVATYSDGVRARNEKERLVKETSLTGFTIPRFEGGAATYEIVLGSFPSRAEAEEKSSQLLSSGTIKQARIVKTAE